MWLSLVERLPWEQEVVGPNPTIQTIYRPISNVTQTRITDTASSGH
jgi:hypothetical protein